MRQATLFILLLAMLFACSSHRLATHSTQPNEIRYRDLLLILPADADRSRLSEQEKVVKDGKYYHQDGRLLPLRTENSVQGQSKLECRTCQSDAPVNQDKNVKPERLEPYIIKAQ